jgi:ribose 1,5-bisphosphokinase
MAEAPLRPGTLVLVVGPSGAGKDTLLAIARSHFSGSDRVRFPHRLVTRAANRWEEHDTISMDDFEAGVADGRWPLWWRAHGLGYALPPSLLEDIAAGRTVVVNLSRTAVSAARARFPRVRVAYITAPPHLLAARIAGRGREPGAGVAERASRRAPTERDIVPDLVIDNSGPPERAAAKLIAVIEAQLAR